MKKVLMLLMFMAMFCFGTSIQQAEQECNDKNYDSCDALGVVYHYGHGETKLNYEKAAKYYKKACDGEFYQSCLSLAILYDRGQGVEQNYEKSAKYYKKACDSNRYVYPCYRLGELYGDGQGVEQDISRAKKYYKKGCDLDPNRARNGKCVE